MHNPIEASKQQEQEQSEDKSEGSGEIYVRPWRPSDGYGISESSEEYDDSEDGWEDEEGEEIVFDRRGEGGTRQIRLTHRNVSREPSAITPEPAAQKSTNIKNKSGGDHDG
jgi:hypothetical protein